MPVHMLVDDVTEMREYRVDWSEWLKDEGDRLVSSTWTAAGALCLCDMGFTDEVATVAAGQGLVGTQIDLTNAVVTANGHAPQHTIRLLLR